MMPKLLKKPRTQRVSTPRLLSGWRSFCELSLNREAGWVALPRWRQRYKALRRSARNHGHKLGTIDALQRGQREWEAKP